MHRQLGSFAGYLPLAGTIRDNICYGKSDASEGGDCGCKAVGAQFIMRLPQGYDTEVHEREQASIASANSSLLLVPSSATPYTNSRRATSSVDAYTE